MDPAVAIDAANPTDMRRETGEKIPERPRLKEMLLTEEDLKTVAQTHEMFGRDRRANELRNLLGEPPRGKVAAFLNRPRRLTVLNLTGAAVIGLAAYGSIRWLRNRRAKRAQLAPVTSLPMAKTASPATAPPPFSPR